MDYYSKTQHILDLCAGRRVLHLGCVGFADQAPAQRIELARTSLHQALTGCAQTTGVDYSREVIDFFQHNGVFDNVLYGNAESLQELGLKPEFDVIVAGDIIEHLSNPGRMLDGIRSVCRPDTLVVLTTVHSFGLLSYLRHLFNRFVEGHEHVFTMNLQNLENIIGRHGFKVVEAATCYQDHARNQRFFKLGRRFFEAFPKLGGTLFVVFRPS